LKEGQERGEWGEEVGDGNKDWKRKSKRVGRGIGQRGGN
jgi:hypothetical protein